MSVQSRIAGFLARLLSALAMAWSRVSMAPICRKARPCCWLPGPNFETRYMERRFLSPGHRARPARRLHSQQAYPDFARGRISRARSFQNRSGPDLSWRPAEVDAVFALVASHDSPAAARYSFRRTFSS